VELYRKRGAEIRAAVQHLWVDQGVNADGTRQFEPPPAAA
jgi:hypothetical protein